MLGADVLVDEKLMGSSLFAELEEADTEPVTEEYLKAVTDELIADLKQLISDYSRPVVRAVYSMALGKLPVFGSTISVMEHFPNSSSGIEVMEVQLPRLKDDAPLA